MALTEKQELTEEQESTLEKHLERCRQSRPEHTARIEELEAQLEILQTRYRKLRPEHRAEHGPKHEHVLRALKLEKALRERARDNPNFVHTFELFAENFIRQRIWSATAEVSPTLRTWLKCPPNLVNKYPESDKQVDTADKNQLFCSDKYRTRSPLQLELFEHLQLDPVSGLN